MGTDGREIDAIEALTAATDTMKNAFIAMTQGFAAMEAAFVALDNVTENITNDDGAEREAGEKTQLDDCAACLCNTCANIESCVHAPEEVHRFVGVRPYPCADCLDGMRYTNLDDACEGYVEGSGNYV